MSGSTPDGAISRFYDILVISGNANFSTTEITNALTYLVSVSVLTPARATATVRHDWRIPNLGGV
jgi:hypothetical protein